jgi:DNA-directed RNA polymerase specialized sigma24 family protein
MSQARNPPQAVDATTRDPPPGWEHDAGSVLDVRGADDPDLSGLTRREREVWLSVEMHGYRPADLAHETGADPSTIRTLLASARRKR